MICIDNHVISEDIIENDFVCNLNACKGACCWEGDFGAPLEEDEIEIINRLMPKIAPFLTAEGLKKIEENGICYYVKSEDIQATILLDNEACAFMTYNELGIACCGIEQAYKAGAIDFKKPISCHLYPIRTVKYLDGDALNYSRWDICNAACEHGKKLQVPVYRFLKEPIIRRYGEEFYEQLEAAAEYLQQSK